MAIMGKPVWAVVCGALRQDFELYTTLAQLCEYRSQGLLDGIVISTWKGDPDKFPHLREKLTALNIHVLELDPLDEDLGKFCNLNYARQAYQLKNGLDFIPDDVFVLKCRTDNNGPLIRRLVKYILQRNVDLSIGTHGAFYSPLNYRIAVYRFSVAPIFYMLDRVFMGYKSDLYKMVNFDNVVSKYGCDIGPDMAFFINICLHTYPIFGELWQFTRQKRQFFAAKFVAKKLQEIYTEDEQKKQDFELPGAFTKCFALYFVILKNCFYSIEDVKKSIKPFYLADVFTANKKIGMTLDPSRMVIRNIEILHMIIHGNCIQTPGYMKLYKEIIKLKDPKYAESMSITRQDYQETYKWIKNVLQLNPSKILNYTMPEPSEYDKADFSKSLDILYSDQSFLPHKKNIFYNVMKNICFSGNKSFNDAVIDNHKFLKQIDNDLFESSATAFARQLRPVALSFLAKELYYKHVSTCREKDYSFIFKRFEREYNFYILPIPSERLCALYYYGKYAEQQGDTFAAKRFYTFLLNYIDDTDRSEPESYADAALALLKEIVSRRCSEYQDNLEIRYMIDFLFDEFGESAFSSDTAERLGTYLAERKYGRPFHLGQADAYTQLLRGAQTARKNEVNCILRLLLREMSNQPENLREKAQQAITDLTRRFAVPESCLLRAGMLNSGASIHIDADEIVSEEDFVLLLRLLCMHTCIAKNHAELMKICGDDKFRWFILSFFERLEKTPAIRFFSIKTSPKTLDVWINYKKFIDTGYDKKLFSVHNAQRIPWPSAETPSLSSFGAFLRLDQVKNRIFSSIELAADRNDAKDALLSLYIAHTKDLDIDFDDRIIRLQRQFYSFTDLKNISLEVNNALDDFCKIGDQLSACAQELDHIPSQSKEQSFISRLCNFLNI